MGYDEWFKEEVQGDSGFRVFGWPIIGWIASIGAFSFHYPIKYLMRKNK